MNIKKELFGKLPDGRDAWLYSLSNRQGMQVSITDYGAIVTRIVTPDKNGEMGDVALGFDDISGYIPNEPHFGGIVGRFANRIANGEFTLNGQTYKLAQNDAPNHLHGGNTGFDRMLWQVEMLEEENAVKLIYLSKDGEEGYPGNLQVTVVYTLTDANELKIDYHATTDKATPINLTNHSYFNLSAGKQPDILDHLVTINADRYTETNETLIPTGKLVPVAGTPYDFREPHRIGERINNLEGYGYDLNYELRKGEEKLTFAASALEPESGRTLEVYTTQPGVQLYTGYWLKGNLTGRNSTTYKRYAGFCLETQHYPDSPNQPAFPDAILRPGEEYKHTTIYKFGTQQV